MTRYYGTGVSQSGVALSFSNKSFENVVFQQNKPIIDREFELFQDINSEKIRSLRANTVPSGWLTWTANPLNANVLGTGTLSAYSTDNYLALGNTVDSFDETVAEKCVVNGWELTIGGTGLSSLIAGNIIDLGAPPSSITSGRLDFVFLEVWLQLLNPTTFTGLKLVSGPSTYGIYPYGNTQWYGTSGVETNQLIDPSYLAETTKRVQLQYKFRVVSIDSGTVPEFTPTTDPFTYVTAYGRASQTSNTAFAFANMGSEVFLNSPHQTLEGANLNLNDAGLWRAGDGDPTNTLASVDGYTYAIPIALVQRFNSHATGYDPILNSQGYLGFRPDGVSASMNNFNILDLRHKVSYTGFDFKKEGEQTKQLNLQNKLGTVFRAGYDSSGVPLEGAPTNIYGTKILYVDGVCHSNPGPPDRPGIDDFSASDNIRRMWKSSAGTQDIGAVFTKTVTAGQYNNTIQYDSATKVLTLVAPNPPVGTVVNSFTPIVRWIANSDTNLSAALTTTVDLSVSWSGLGTTSATATIDSGSAEFLDADYTKFYVYAKIDYPVDLTSSPTFDYEDVLEVRDTNTNESFSFAYSDGPTIREGNYLGADPFSSTTVSSTYSVVDYATYDPYAWDDATTGFTGNITLEENKIPRFARPCSRQLKRDYALSGASTLTVPITIDLYTVTSIMGVVDSSGNPIDVVDPLGYVRGVSDWTVTFTTPITDTVTAILNVDAPGVAVSRAEGGITETYKTKQITGTYINNATHKYTLFTCESVSLDMPGTPDLYGTYLPVCYFNTSVSGTGYSSFIIVTDGSGTYQFPVFEPLVGATPDTSRNGTDGIMQFVALETALGTTSTIMAAAISMEVPHLERAPLVDTENFAVFSNHTVYQGFEPDVSCDVQEVVNRLPTMISSYGPFNRFSFSGSTTNQPSISTNPIPKFIEDGTFGSGLTLGDFTGNMYGVIPTNHPLHSLSTAIRSESLYEINDVFGRKTDSIYAVPFKAGDIIDLNSDVASDFGGENGQLIFGCLLGSANGGTLVYWIAPNFIGLADNGKLYLTTLNQIKESDVLEFNVDPNDPMFTNVSWLESRCFIPYGRPLVKNHKRIGLLI